MPLIIIHRNPAVVCDARLVHIAEHLPEVVAAALSCDEGPVSAEDVSIEISDVGAFDKNVRDLNIRVHAHYFAERAADLGMRQQRISRGIRELFPECESWSVWVLLHKGSHGTSELVF